LREFLDPVVNRFARQTFPAIKNISLLISFALSPFAYKKRTRERCSSVVHSSSTVAILTNETASEHAHVQRLVSVFKIATVLEGCTTEEELLFVRFLWAKGLDAKNIHKKCCLFTVGNVCR
jgi:hypothetical protein